MPETVDREQSHARLREFLDALSTRVVVNGFSRGVADDLARLSEMAAGDGCLETARIAAGLAARTRVVGEVASLDSELLDGLAQLAQALDRDESRAPGRPGSQSPEPPPNSLAQDAELVGEFVLESREHLAAIEKCMLVIEQTPGDVDAIHSVFRGFHTMKGLAGFLGFRAIQEVAHEVETLLDLARNSKLSITPGVVDTVLASADFLQQAVTGVEDGLTGRPAPLLGNQAELVSRIRAEMTDGGTAAPPATPPANSAGPEAVAAPAAPDPAPEVAASLVPPAALGEASAAPAKEQRAARPADAASVRVETGKLDYLMDMVGEMVIAQSLIRHNASLAMIQDPRLQADLSQLARITGEVQRTAMGMRMIPIGQLFQRTARLVRDLSRRFGKRVELETSGEDTELDKTIAEQLADPFLHMVRNSLDHGIEPPEDRIAAGKNPVARIRLAAYHQGGQIGVEISDDGRGLDREKILRKARQNGLIGDNAQLTDTEIFHLIFEPGFSTAERVTDVSGRGVGMDVVRKHVQKLRGRIEIQSQAGKGTTFCLKLPLTLAIIEGLVVVVGPHRYIIPIFAVKEMFRPTLEGLSTIHNRDEMALVRGRLLPIVRLHRRFGVQPRSEDPCQGLLVVAECEGRQFCVLVDDLAGKQEVVIKSLGEGLKNIPGVAGGAILGDGRVGLILDMDGVYRGASRD